MIYTLTPNPAVDMVVSCDALVPNRVTRTRDASYSPNGKGLNVAFVLGHFGVPATILGFFGGFSGEWVVREAAKVCPVLPVRIDGITRINVFVSAGEDEYTMPNAGAPVPRARQLEMLELVGGLDDLDTLVISGSLSPLMDPSYYDELVGLCRAKGAEVVLDMSDRSLAQLVEQGPLLIKPNDEEMASVFGVDASSADELVRGLCRIREHGARNILCTLGGAGAYFADERHVWRATAARVRTLSTACAGDATLAAFLSLWLDDRDAVAPALVRAMATGANVAMSAGLGDLALVDELAKRIEVERIA